MKKGKENKEDKTRNKEHKKEQNAGRRAAGRGAIPKAEQFCLSQTATIGQTYVFNPNHVLNTGYGLI